MKHLLASTLFILTVNSLTAQTNVRLSNPIMAEVLDGDFVSEDYAGGMRIDDPQEITEWLNDEISADTLKKLVLEIASFGNRNTGADTVSNTWGMGAARRWAKSVFDDYARRVNGRLLTGYVDFDADVCGMSAHRNMIAVLPGYAPEEHGIILIEGHIDSRCEDPCDIDCIAQGVEDNATGTALVMELARVMSQLSFKHTMVFMCTTGEEQGLIGADAMALYAQERNLPIKAVLNNDVIGGIICGATSSPPSCPGENLIDSTQVRIFSSGGGSVHKQLARYVKLQYGDMLIDEAKVPMNISIMSAEDRTGRGGDHIPFRRRGFPAIRFTSAHEHGNANPTPGYTDRQHSHRDVAGVDLDGDGMVDSFFVDFNYLRRNATINANAAAMISRAPVTPDFEVFRTDNFDILLRIYDSLDYDNYLVSVRQTGTEWDTLIQTTEREVLLPFSTGGIRFISVASVDSAGVESCFGQEEFARTTSTEDLIGLSSKIELMQNVPNPFDEATYINVLLKEEVPHDEALLRIFDHTGREIKRDYLDLKLGLNEYLFRHGYNRAGTYYYGLWIDGEKVDVKSMIFAY